MRSAKLPIAAGAQRCDGARDPGTKASDFLAGATGLEPAASCVTGRRSNQLNYATAWDTLLLPTDIARFPLVSSRSLPLHLTVP